MWVPYIINTIERPSTLPPRTEDNPAKMILNRKKKTKNKNKINIDARSQRRQINRKKSLIKLTATIPPNILSW